MPQASLSHDDALLLIRALRVYSKRCLDIAAEEMKKIAVVNAEHMRLESRRALDIVAKLERGGVF